MDFLEGSWRRGVRISDGEKVRMSLTTGRLGQVISMRPFPTFDSPQGGSLEQAFSSSLEEQVNKLAHVRFTTAPPRSSLVPYEGGIDRLKPHLVHSHSGIGVVFGTERLFFTLLKSVEVNGERCLGVLGRHPSWEVLAYNHFNVTLLRLARDREDYLSLSSHGEEESEEWIEEKVQEVQRRIETASLPPFLKQLLDAHIHSFAHVYYRSSQKWRISPHFPAYHKEDSSFSILHRYASEGNIFPTLGEIDDLAFLGEQQVTFIDTATCSDVAFLDMRIHGQLLPRLIWTLPNPMATLYFSCPLELLSPEQREELDVLLHILTEAGSIRGATPHRQADLKLCCQSVEFSQLPLQPVGWFAGTLANLKEYKERYLLHIPPLGWVDLFHNVIKLNRLSSEQLSAQLVKMTLLRQHLSLLVDSWEIVRPDLYCAFSVFAEWKEFFLQRIQTNNERFKKHCESIPFLRTLLEELCEKI